MIYGLYSHSEAPTAPIGDLNSNIVGLELEIQEVYDERSIEDLIGEGTIETEETSSAPVVMEYEADGNIMYELIFKADTPANIKRRVEYISDSIRSDCGNFEGSSAHVHINRSYMESIGLTEIDIWRAAEVISPIIYKISGRDLDYWREWSNSITNQNKDILHCCRIIDKFTPYNDSRYYMVNVRNSRSIEIRGFSNAFNFDIGAINLYIDISSQLIPGIAYDMKNKEYKSPEGIKTVFETLNNFFKTRPQMVRRFNLEKLLDYTAAKKEAKKLQIKDALHNYYRINSRIRSTRRNGGTPLDSARSILYTLEDFPEANTKFSGNLNLNNLENSLQELERINHKLFLRSLF